jgi:hypothetical protein
VGAAVGLPVGPPVGPADGDAVEGESDGSAVVGDALGELDGEAVGPAEGSGVPGAWQRLHDTGHIPLIASSSGEPASARPLKEQFPQNEYFPPPCASSASSSSVHSGLGVGAFDGEVVGVAVVGDEDGEDVGSAVVGATVDGDPVGEAVGPRVDSQQRPGQICAGVFPPNGKVDEQNALLFAWLAGSHLPSMSTYS